MFYGRFQVAIASVFYVVGCATGVLLLFRELLGFDPVLVFVIWLCVLVVSGRAAYLRWRRDWGPSSVYAKGDPGRDSDGPVDEQGTPHRENPPKATP